MIRAFPTCQALLAHVEKFGPSLYEREMVGASVRSGKSRGRNSLTSHQYPLPIYTVTPRRKIPDNIFPFQALRLGLLLTDKQVSNSMFYGQCSPVTASHLPRPRRHVDFVHLV
jgi:hypothetical protein